MVRVCPRRSPSYRADELLRELHFGKRTLITPEEVMVSLKGVPNVTMPLRTAGARRANIIPQPV